MMQDHWKHRSENMSCKTCMWFIPKVSSVPFVNTNALEVDELELKPGRITSIDHTGLPEGGPMRIIPPSRPVVGRCRRHAPTMGGFPVVFEADWCGDHKLDENKA